MILALVSHLLLADSVTTPHSHDLIEDGVVVGVVVVVAVVVEIVVDVVVVGSLTGLDVANMSR